jgi:hypothetical protein
MEWLAETFRYDGVSELSKMNVTEIPTPERQFRCWMVFVHAQSGDTFDRLPATLGWSQAGCALQAVITVPPSVFLA